MRARLRTSALIIFGCYLRGFLLLVATMWCPPGFATSRLHPSWPEFPKSDEECQEWKSRLDGYAAEFLSNVRVNDALCKSHYSGPYSNIKGTCGNIVTDPVEHKNPCDEETKYDQCFKIELTKGMKSCQDKVARFVRQKKNENEKPTAKTSQQSPGIGGSATAGNSLKVPLANDNGDDVLTCSAGNQACVSACLQSAELRLEQCARQCEQDRAAGSCFQRNLPR
jgi:hypothetical protein